VKKLGILRSSKHGLRPGKKNSPPSVTSNRIRMFRHMHRTKKTNYICIEQKKTNCIVFGKLRDESFKSN
jgi:hypothetical protein